MDQEKKESVVRTAENFVKKSEVEKAFVLGYMFKRMQLKELEESRMGESELAGK